LLARALQTLPQELLPEAHFIDIGCGMGRGMLVAAAFPFKSVSGIDISIRLTQRARENIAIYNQNHTQAPPLHIIDGDACTLPCAGGNLVLFLYNPFGGEMMDALLQSLEERLEQDVTHAFLIYQNPVWGDVLDDSPSLERWAALQMRCLPEERGYGYPSEGATVIWQSKRGALPCPHKNRNRTIRVFDDNATRLKRWWFDIF
jgi:SAM-dependent methyltransferase